MMRAGSPWFRLSFGIVAFLSLYTALQQSLKVTQVSEIDVAFQPENVRRSIRVKDNDIRNATLGRSSLFSMMRTRGREFHNERQNRSGNLTVDALSIGSNKRLKLLTTQSRTFALHRSIRHYFGTTEADDADPTCGQTVNLNNFHEIAHKCRYYPPHVKDDIKWLYGKFALNFLVKGSGWLCAQQRFATAISKLGRFYRSELEVNDAALPDFLFIQDDDTYLNMVKMEEYLKDYDPSRPMASAPCMFRYTRPIEGKSPCLIPYERPKYEKPMSFPWGGFGFILSKGAIENLIRPVHCQKLFFRKSKFERLVCARLKDNLLGEARFFEEGMSVSDLMGAHVENNLFKDFASKDWGYCLHGDWAIGYFVNYYYIGSQIDNDPLYKRIPEFRIESTLGEINQEGPERNRGNCDFNDPKNCTAFAHVCHWQNARSMLRLTRGLSAQSPGAFTDFLSLENNATTS